MLLQNGLDKNNHNIPEPLIKKTWYQSKIQTMPEIEKTKNIQLKLIAHLKINKNHHQLHGQEKHKSILGSLAHF